ncbi:tumor necrosis factor alpha-induced protein 8-like protein [Lingula anatina]|uniref:Tumor necrosis factor alpha-induced protein 8-like protein n=1 Tax=Lingula anatina TaxID=7574 RepID=A0A1S3I6W5_LINAN|nr:tumor necrosis factor alpha-induced protein 8-like protein [Lingula anatina]|eukprot:XP_013393953.1 tumor necrosis factor alpha-induced protein 8-like protein [Lingula anatina]
MAEGNPKEPGNVANGEDSAEGGKEGASENGAASGDQQQFRAQSLGLRIQKKWAGKLAKKDVAKIFIDDQTGHLLDVLFSIAKDYSGSKGQAEKLVKHMIKMPIKIGILYRHNQFNSDELSQAENFREKFHVAARTFVKMYEGKMTFDAQVLANNLRECRDILKLVINNHLTPKSHDRLDHVVAFFGDPEFLTAVFQKDGPYRQRLGEIVTECHQLMDQGIL